MNFLLNAIEGNGGDFGDDDDGGWGSDEDLDLSDTEATGSNNGENSDAMNLPPHHQQGNPHHPQQREDHGDNSAEGNFQMGGGMFMGRLTQFLDVVAPQIGDEDDMEDGWQDDDEVDVEGWEDDDGQDILSMLEDDDDAANDAIEEGFGNSQNIIDRSWSRASSSSSLSCNCV